MIKIELEEWQVKNLRNYFGENDKTQTAHWAYKLFNNALKQQCDIPVVGSSFVEYEKQVSLDSVVLKDITDDGTVRGRYILDDGKLYKVELVEKFTLLELK